MKVSLTGLWRRMSLACNCHSKHDAAGMEGGIEGQSNWPSKTNESILQFPQQAQCSWNQRSINLAAEACRTQTWHSHAELGRLCAAVLQTQVPQALGDKCVKRAIAMVEATQLESKINQSKWPLMADAPSVQSLWRVQRSWSQRLESEAGIERRD